MENDYLQSVIKQFEYYKMLGEKALLRIPDDKLNWQPNEGSNSAAMIVKHLSGNMVSRWTDLLTTDGEKPWRDRDREFENDLVDRREVLDAWERGWNCCLSTIRSLTPEHLSTIIYIRNQGHTVIEAMNRQLAHYPYHVGQIVFIAKMVANEWESLSIPRGNSKQFNESRFQQDKRRQHFTDEYLDNQK